MENPIPVNSVQEFVARVTEEPLNAKDRLDFNVSSGTFYRGQADSSWYLCPSLYREDLFHQERTLISELRRVRPEEFKGLTEFDILVKMQHYGLPTRLLDMTHNPLVALYFACESATERDGSVYAFRNMPVFWQENYAVRLIMSYVFDFSGPKLDLGRFVRVVSKDPIVSGTWNEESELRDTVLHYLTKVPVIAVRPSLANLRISRQDGAFLLFGMILEKKEVSTNPGTKGDDCTWSYLLIQEIKRLSIYGISRRNTESPLTARWRFCMPWKHWASHGVDYSLSYNTKRSS